MGPLTGPRRIFAEGLGRSSLPWENQTLGRILRSPYNRSRITRIRILSQRITSPYVRPKPANLRTRRYLGPVADQGFKVFVKVHKEGEIEEKSGYTKTKQARGFSLSRYPFSRRLESCSLTTRESRQRGPVIMCAPAAV